MIGSSSSSLPAVAGPCAMNRYVLSMQRLCVAVGLPIPHHPLFAAFNNNRHIPETDRALRLTDEYASANIFFHAEDTPEWKSYLYSLHESERHRASVRRRLSTQMFFALQKVRCLYCWLPEAMCVCADLQAERIKVEDALVNDHVDATMLLHVEEMMRTTNTGHLAAFILGSGVRVWGIEEDDSWLQEAAEQNSMTCRVGDAPDDGNDSLVEYYVLLYPEDGSLHISELTPGCDNEGMPGTARPLPSQLPAAEDDTGAADTSTKKRSRSPRAYVAERKLHFILSDGTWGQAHRLNRHVPRQIPRVALTIDATYESLFAPLRKQTRITGVSTLEATTMAMVQRLRALQPLDKTLTDFDVIADLVQDCLITTMKQYVDCVSVQKRQPTVYNRDPEHFEALRIKRNEAWAVNNTVTLNKRVSTASPEDDADKMKSLLIPPVLNYCYVCNQWVGWKRMVGHCLGSKHADALKVNPTGEPSAFSRELSQSCHYVRNEQRCGGSSAQRQGDKLAVPIEAHFEL